MALSQRSQNAKLAMAELARFVDEMQGFEGLTPVCGEIELAKDHRLIARVAGKLCRLGKYRVELANFEASWDGKTWTMGAVEPLVTELLRDSMERHVPVFDTMMSTPNPAECPDKGTDTERNNDHQTDAGTDWHAVRAELIEFGDEVRRATSLGVVFDTMIKKENADGGGAQATVHGVMYPVFPADSVSERLDTKCFIVPVARFNAYWTARNGCWHMASVQEEASQILYDAMAKVNT